MSIPALVTAMGAGAPCNGLLLSNNKDWVEVLGEGVSTFMNVGATVHTVCLRKYVVRGDRVGRT